MVKIVMVDVLTSFRNRYAIEVNDDEPAEYALDDIVCNQELTEFSQFHIGDQIISHRVVPLLFLCEIFQHNFFHFYMIYFKKFKLFSLFFFF